MVWCGVVGRHAQDGVVWLLLSTGSTRRRPGMDYVYRSTQGTAQGHNTAWRGVAQHGRLTWLVAAMRTLRRSSCELCCWHSQRSTSGVGCGLSTWIRTLQRGQGSGGGGVTLPTAVTQVAKLAAL